MNIQEIVDEINKTLAECMVERRMSLGLTQAQFATLLGYSGQSVVSRKETCRRKVTLRDQLCLEALEYRAAASRLAYGSPNERNAAVEEIGMIFYTCCGGGPQPAR